MLRNVNRVYEMNNSCLCV